MRFLIIALTLAALTTSAVGQENTVQTFQGKDAPVTTPSFKVTDRWEIRWDSPTVLALTLRSADGSTIIAGAAGSNKGSFYQPAGGTFTLEIDPSAQAQPWHVSIVELGATPASPAATANPAITENYVPPLATNTVAAAAVPAASTGATNTTSNTPPPAALSTAPLGSNNLTQDQAQAVVLIKGDVSEGTGFFVKTPDGPAVITNQHVLSANPNVKIVTTTGEEVKITGLKGASDRDLAMFSIQDNHYAYLAMNTNIQGSVQPGDEVITPGNSEGGEVMLNTRGKVLGIGPEKIEVDNPVYHGNSGGPIFHTASKTVVGVVTEGMKVRNSDALDAASFANKNSAISGSMRYFGLRIDNVPIWETFDWNRYLGETTFLKGFHDQSRCLDSFLNGAKYEKLNLASSDAEEGPPDSHYFLRNEKISAAADNFRRLTLDADKSQRLDAIRELTMDLDTVADTDMSTVQNPSNFYGFDQHLAANEVKYRQALRTEIQNVESKVTDLGH